MSAFSPTRLGAHARQAFGLAGLAGSVLRRSIGRRFPELDLDARLAMVPRQAPLDAPLVIRWNEHHVPFVEAASERDGAVGLGIVHGHLRLAQMELMRRVAFGRVAEVAGEAAVDLDRLLRLVDFPRATAPSLALLPRATRDWLEGFAAGISAAAAATPPPPEFAVLSIVPEPWTVEDLFAVSRLCSADYAWKVWRTLNGLREHPDWAEMWADLVGVTAVADEDIPIGADALDEALPTAFNRAGSNCYAVAGSRTRSGKPLLACDPHHLVTAPGLWLIAGVRTPSLRLWGVMLPALPIFGVGRNEHGAWGGTNLHATSSELVDVGDEAVETQSATIAVRGGGSRTVTLRQCALGPIISDAKPFRMPAGPVALHWLGHRPSDEFTPFCDMIRARDWSTFHDAMDRYAMLGLNMIWADSSGTIGKMIAAHVPRRPLATPSDFVISREEAHRNWSALVTGRDLPQSVNPPGGVVASANEEPQDSPVAISLFFAADHRRRRIHACLEGREDLTADDLKALQRDTYFAPAAELSGDLARLAATVAADSPITAQLAAWDGCYGEESAGALAFELVAARLVRELEARSPKRLVSPYWRPFSRLTRLVEAAAPDDLTAALKVALASAQAPFARARTWGGLHKVRLAHPLARLPWLAPRLPTLEFPTGGSNDTLMKTMHPLTQKVHVTNFGANARFVADLADPDATWAVLLGGQDGWPGSRTMFDQVGAWRRGDLIALPMREAAVREAFAWVTTVAPAGPTPPSAPGREQRAAAHA